MYTRCQVFGCAGKGKGGGRSVREVVVVVTGLVADTDTPPVKCHICDNLPTQPLTPYTTDSLLLSESNNTSRLYILISFLKRLSQSSQAMYGNTSATAIHTHNVVLCKCNKIKQHIRTSPFCVGVNAYICGLEDIQTHKTKCIL